MSKKPFVAIVAACALASSVTNHAQLSPAGVQEPAWSPDGKRVAVSYLDRIWTMAADGKQARPIVAESRTQVPQDLVEREPAWSPDGTRIAYALNRGTGFDIVVVAMKNGLATGNPTTVTTLPGDERWPSWTADGRIVFAHRAAPPAGRNGDPSLQYDIYISVPVSGSDAWQAPLPLSETTDSETYPRVSPDGLKVAFISERESEDDLDLWWMPV
ncbi:MAG: TolB family protein, partial [Acidimicrobiia bacterium]